MTDEIGAFRVRFVAFRRTGSCGASSVRWLLKWSLISRHRGLQTCRLSSCLGGYDACTEEGMELMALEDVGANFPRFEHKLCSRQSHRMCHSTLGVLTPTHPSGRSGPETKPNRTQAVLSDSLLD